MHDPASGANDASVTIRLLIATPVQGVSRSCAETDVLQLSADPSTRRSSSFWALHIGAARSVNCGALNTTTTQRPRRILWKNVLTVVSAAILIGAEVFGAAFAGSWAIATLLGLGTIGARLLDGLFVLCGIIVMVLFVRSARRIEPFIADEHRPLRR